jgi:surfactin family lipopeptide synthetase A
VKEYFPAVQKGIWITQNRYFNSLLYNVGGYAYIEGDINVTLLIEAIELVIDKNGLLDQYNSFRRTVWGDNLPSLEIGSPRYLDFSHYEDSLERGLDWMQSDIKHKRALAEEIFTCRIFKLADNKHYWYVKTHHIIFDGFSMSLFFEKVAKVYNDTLSEEELLIKEPVYNYSKFIDWERKYKESPKYNQDKTFWVEKLTTDPTNLSFESCFKSKITKEFNSERIEFVIPRKIFDGIQRFCKDHKFSAFQYFIGVILIANKLYNNGAITIGLPHLNRPTKELKRVLGTCINTIPLKVSDNLGGNSFIELLKIVKQELKLWYRHSKMPMIDALEELNISSEQLFNILFSYQKNPYLDNLGEAKAQINYLHNGQQLEDLVFHLLEYSDEDDLKFAIDYRSGVFSNETIRGLAKHINKLITNLYLSPHTNIDTVDYLSSEERHLLLEGFNETHHTYDQSKSVVSLFEEQVKNNPDRVALVYGKRSMSYRELNDHSNRMAHYLLLHHQIQNEELVGIMLDRSEDLLVSILGVLKAGGAYVPIDPDYPEERKKYILSHSQCKLVLDSEELSQCKESIERLSTSNPSVTHKGEDLAYVIYTSGSTGKPKGVMIEHRNVSSFIQWSLEEFAKSNYQVVYGVTSICFDLSIFEIFHTLCSGKKLRLLKNALSIGTYLNEDTHVLLNTVPSVVSSLLENGQDLGSVSVLNMAGEPIPSSIVERLDYTSMEVRNLYGPSEDTTYSSCSKLTDNSATLIGKPITNTSIYITNSSLQLTALGVIGEICISGSGVCRGYLRDPHLTSEKFVDNPYSSGTKLYRTGDLGRWLPDGNIEFIGRKDDQVKVRGYRIELGEVNHALHKLESIKSSYVTVVDLAEGRDIVAYVVCSEKLNISKIRAELSDHLPYYMVPTYYVELEKIPLTPNGKIDKKALPSPNKSKIARDVEYLAPSTEIEIQLAKIWRDVLDINHEKISTLDDFFILGGNSLKVSKLLSRIYQDFGITLNLSTLFEVTILSEQSDLILKTEKTTSSEIQLLAHRQCYDLSSAQKRLWVLSRFESAKSAYNMPVVYKIFGTLDQVAFEKSFRYLIYRHEILRTSFYEDNTGTIKQWIKDSDQTSFTIQYYDYRDSALTEAQLHSQIKDEIISSFDLERDSLLRISLIHLKENEYFLVSVLHHIISDGWSTKVMMRELNSLYNSYVNKKVIALSPLRIQYKEFAAWQQKQLQSEEFKRHKQYWLNHLAGELPILELQSDRARPRIMTYHGGVAGRKISKELVTKLQYINSEVGNTMFMGLLGLVNLLLYRHTHQTDIVIGTPVAGRNHLDLEGQIGLYINTLALRTRFNATDSFVELLKKVKEVTLNAYDHQSYPFDQLVDDLQLSRDTSRNPLFDVMVTFQSSEIIDSLDFKGVTVQKHEIQDAVFSKFDLMFTFTEHAENLSVTVEYNSDIFNENTIQRLLDHFEQLLISVTADPAQTLHKLNYLTNRELHLLLDDFNATQVEYPSDKTIVSLFWEQVEKTPDQIAVVCEDVNISYSELNERSNRLAHYLKRKHDIVEGDLVGVLQDRGIEMIISIFGILKAGGAYVPIDPQYPKERIEYILSNSQCKLVLDSVELECFQTNAASYPVTNPVSNIKESDLAYVIYTSGSTGRPKGVMIEHRNATSFIQWSLEEFTNSNYEVVYGVTSICFDLSVFEIFHTLCSGKKLRVLKNALSIGTYLAEDSAVLLNTVPSVVSSLLENGQDLGTVGVLNMAGEPIPLSVIDRLKYESMEIRNLYGPSEDTTYSTCYKITLGSSVLIGKPIANTKIYITDDTLQLTAIGGIGEICISGKGVSRGYLNDEYLTSEKFVANPYEEGTKLYRTGDLGRWLPDGNIEFIGRKDDQVKVRGYRIELGEIRYILDQLEGIISSYVTVTELAEGQDLVAYLVCEQGVTTSKIREELNERLPSYMVPSYYVLLEDLPLTPNGKIDRKSLPSPKDSGGTKEAEYIAPRNDIERQLIKIWSEVLALDQEEIGVKQNFFEIGGNSLKAMKVISRIRESFNLEVSIEDFLSQFTVARLHELISNSKGGYEDQSLKPVSRSLYKMN